MKYHFKEFWFSRGLVLPGCYLLWGTLLPFAGLLKYNFKGKCLFLHSGTVSIQKFSQLVIDEQVSQISDQLGVLK